MKEVLIGEPTDFPSLVWPRFSCGSAFSMLTRAIQFWGMKDWNLGECGERARLQAWHCIRTAADGTLATRNSKSVPGNLRGSPALKDSFDTLNHCAEIHGWQAYLRVRKKGGGLRK